MSQILVLEESTRNFNQMKIAVERYGHKVWLARSIADALSFLNRHPVDLIISQVRLETDDVFDFLRSIKTDSSLKDIPFVFQSADAYDTLHFATEMTRKVAKSLGAYKYIITDDFDRFWHQLEECLPKGSIKRDSLGSNVRTYGLGEARQ